jgi:hypothetical protein
VCPYTHAAEFSVVEVGRRVVGMLDELLRRWHDQPEALVGAVRRQEIPVAQPEESVTTAQRQLGEEARLLTARPQLVLTDGAGRIQAIENGPFKTAFGDAVRGWPAANGAYIENLQRDQTLTT